MDAIKKVCTVNKAPLEEDDKVSPARRPPLRRGGAWSQSHAISSKVDEASNPNIQKMAALRVECDEANAQVEEMKARIKTLEQENLAKEQEITSLGHKNSVLESEVEKLETGIKEAKAAAEEGSHAGSQNESLNRRLQVLEDEAEQADRTLRETNEKYVFSPPEYTPAHWLFSGDAPLQTVSSESVPSDNGASNAGPYQIQLSRLENYHLNMYLEHERRMLDWQSSSKPEFWKILPKMILTIAANEKMLMLTIDRLRQTDVKAGHYERKVQALEQSNVQWEQKYEEMAKKYSDTKKELDDFVAEIGNI